MFCMQVVCNRITCNPASYNRYFQTEVFQRG
jgi:hypothetical protein